MSFLDSESTCTVLGFACSSLCAAGTASNATVNGMAHAYVAAFYERWIPRGRRVRHLPHRRPGAGALRDDG